MSTLTTAPNCYGTDTQKKEIRALALQAAATWSVGYGRTATDTVLEVARDFEDYIENGTIPSDDADDLDIDGTGQ